MKLQLRKFFAPVLFLAVLALFFAGMFADNRTASAQKVKQMPAPPPVPRYKPKPTPTPAPIEYEIVKVTSNLVIVPVSVTDPEGQPVLGLKPADFRIRHHRAVNLRLSPGVGTGSAPLRHRANDVQLRQHPSSCR